MCVDWRLRGLDRFYAPVLWFGPWFGWFGRMGVLWLIVVLWADRWDSADFRCGGWWVVGCRVVLVWTGLVFGVRFPVWPLIRVLRADGLAVVDCLCVCGSLEFSGFLVSQRLMVGCRPVLARTGFDFVV